jgi:hypothetical protein
MQSAVLLLQGAVQKRISRGQPVRRTPAGNLVGLDPSLPGESPKVVSSRLRTSIAHDVRQEPNMIVGRVGSNLTYARRLELGFFGTDSLGRNFNQAERPYLRPALAENLPRLTDILTRSG